MPAFPYTISSNKLIIFNRVTFKFYSYVAPGAGTGSVKFFDSCDIAVCIENVKV